MSDELEIGENLGCSAAVIVALLAAALLLALWIRQPAKPDPSVECVRAGGTWVAFHCERSPK